jgi:multidrug efflux pump subunit AcrA (membrane-fusion protein)
MRAPHRSAIAAVIAAAAGAVLLTACGDTPQVSEAATSPPLTADKVDITLTGDGVVTIVNPSADVSFKLDNARLLVVHVKVHSTASAAQTVSIRASLFDAQGKLIGDATGGALAVPAGGDAAFDLSGPAPNGTIRKATFEVHVTASPKATP